MDLDDDNDSLESMIDPSGTIEGAYFALYPQLYLVSTEPHISRRPICVICSALPHDARTGFSFVTYPTDGPASPNRRFYRLHLAPALIRTRGQQRGSQRRTRCRRLGCPSNDAITPLAGHDLRASPSAVPVAAPRASVEPPAPESATPSTDAGSGMGTGIPAVESSRSSPAPQADARSPQLSWLPSDALLSPPPPADLRSPRVVPRLRCGSMRPPESLLAPLRTHVSRLCTTPPEPMGGRIALVCTHCRTGWGR
ncbi:hypothetical protein BC826DRAFT_1185660 [Russula brevipes]|nr:hypothetical protein BC826DRAFT_1185660 [Russula brevipes]